MTRTHGHRMNRERTREVLDKLAIPVVKSNGYGIEIHRAVGRKDTPALGTPLADARGGGVAGNSDKVWISPVVRVLGHAPRGPYWNKGQLEKDAELRRISWRRGE